MTSEFIHDNSFVGNVLFYDIKYQSDYVLQSSWIGEIYGTDNQTIASL